MREIIFRGKRTNNRTWTCGYLFSIWERYYLCWGTTNDIPNMDEVIPETVGQYTGLTDKNGRKIFEGDIVKYGDTLGVINFSEHGCFCVKTNKPNCNDKNNPAIDIVMSKYEIEVVGNIYDNPKLLEEIYENINTP